MNANMAIVVSSTKETPEAFSILYSCLKGVHIISILACVKTNMLYSIDLSSNVWLIKAWSLLLSALAKSPFVQVVDRLCLPVLFMTLWHLHMGVFKFFFLAYICISIIVEQRVDFCLFLRGILKGYKDINAAKTKIKRQC